MKIRFGSGEIEAQPGDSIASALYRSGQRIFSRSFKYHRPRGLLCVSGNCPNCLMNVDGIPNVRTCITPARDGMVVKHQNAWPSLESDVLSAAQWFDWLMPVGWYYKVFTNPSTWHTVEPMIRKIAGLGELLPTQDRNYEHSWLHAEVVVIGGGRAGTEAAIKSQAAGCDVVLIDDQPGKRDDLPGIRVLTHSYCFGIYEGNLLGVVQHNPHPGAAERLVHIRAGSIFLATGAYETPIPFTNNDLPGVMLSTGVRFLMERHKIQPGKRAVVIGQGERAETIEKELRAIGTEVVAVVPAKDVVEATGGSQVSGLRTVDARHSCDLVVMCGPRVPNTGLAAQAGAKVVVLGDASPAADKPVTTAASSAKRTFVCLCSDVTEKDLCDAVEEGFEHIETLKRYTTTTMGPCQGKMCQLTAVGICARETNEPMDQMGFTTARPPNPGVTLGALAGPRHHPVRRTPMHEAHQALGAEWLDMGAWKRPRYYGLDASNVELEYRAVRERCGLIDVSTLGKLEVKGADAGKLLDLIYTHRFSDLKPGRSRYALMCDESGIILDDGTISRLDQNRYFVTTTTGNLDFVHQQLDWTLVGSGWDVQVTNVTGSLGSMNIAGPKAREVLGKLTDLGTFPYMSCRETQVAGIPAILLRIGFTGETGWEIHCASESAEWLWNKLLETGKESGIKPFGVEAQRLLRLEKKHVIIGVDTDALTNPYEADLAWVVKLDKPDFAGKKALADAGDEPPRERLVGWVLAGKEVPPDGAAIVSHGKLAGRVTSSRYSPFKRAAIGLALVEPSKAKEGESIGIRVNGKIAKASVTLKAFYDPDGARLKE